MIAMSVFATALPLTTRTHLWQVSMMQQIGRHRMALRALEARNAVDEVRNFARVGRRNQRGGRNIPAASDGDAIVALIDALTVGLPSARWTRTYGEGEGNGWTLCWKQSTEMKNHSYNSMDSDIYSVTRDRPQERVDAIRCESLALP